MSKISGIIRLIFSPFKYMWKSEVSLRRFYCYNCDCEFEEETPPQERIIFRNNLRKCPNCGSIARELTGVSFYSRALIRPLITIIFTLLFLSALVAFILSKIL